MTLTVEERTKEFIRLLQEAERLTGITIRMDYTTSRVTHESGKISANFEPRLIFAPIPGWQPEPVEILTVEEMKAEIAANGSKQKRAVHK